MLATANTLDLILAGLVAMFLVRGIMRGLVAEVAGLACIIAGIWAASEYQHLAFPFFELAFGDNTGWARITAYLVVFLVVFIGLGLAFRLVEKLLKLAYAGWLNRLAGGVLGGVKGILFALVVFLLVDTFLPDAAFVQSSQLAPYAREYGGTLKSFALDYADEAESMFRAGNRTFTRDAGPIEQDSGSTSPAEPRGDQPPEPTPLEKYPPQPIKPPRDGEATPPNTLPPARG